MEPSLASRESCFRANRITSASPATLVDLFFVNDDRDVYLDLLQARYERYRR